MTKYFVIFLIVSTMLFANEKNYISIDIHNIGFEKLQSIKNNSSIEWWVELEDTLLTLVATKDVTSIKEKYNCRVLPVEVKEQDLHFVRRAHQKDLMIPGLEILGNAGRTAVVQAQKSCVLGIGQCHDSHYTTGVDASTVHASLAPFQKNVVLGTQLANEQPKRAKTYTNDYSALADSVDKARWTGVVNKLSSYNRYTHGDEILEARDWLASQYKELGLKVSIMDFNVSFTTAYNVIAVMEGTEKPDEWFIVGGHYDSISQSPSTAAPGSEDNASGASGVLEMARAFAKNPPKSTVIFINFAGEEQGLIGSKEHVKRLFKNGEDKKIKAVLNMDMISYSSDDDLDLLLETGNVGKHLFVPFTEAAEGYTSLRIVTSLRPFGSDHVPYINKGIPALLTIENDWDEYGPYHTTNDRPSKINTELGYQVLRMNVVALAMLME